MGILRYDFKMVLSLMFFIWFECVLTEISEWDNSGVITVGCFTLLIVFLMVCYDVSLGM